LGKCAEPRAGFPEDLLANTYFERAIEYERNAPGENWNAVEVFTKK
jgi:hypothetical protein